MTGTRPALKGHKLSPEISWLAVASVIYLALATYGSLVPLRFQPRPAAEAWGHFREMPWLHPTFGSRSDWAVNILLFIPLGFLATGVLRLHQPRLGKILACFLVVIVSSACACLIEFAQEFFPPRNPSQNDVIGLTLGASIGSVLWLSTSSKVSSFLMNLKGARGSQVLAMRILPAYLALFLFTQFMPLDLATSPTELVHKYREGRIRPLPFTGLATDPWAAVSKAIDVSVGFAPLGWLVAVGRRPEARSRWDSLLGAFGVGIVLAGGIEFAQVFVLSRYSDSTDVLTGGLGFALGWWAGRLASAVIGRRWAFSPIALGLWSVAAAFSAWQPFSFDWSPSAGWDHLRGSVVAPFADYQSGNEFHALDQLLHKGLLFAILGVILASRSRLPRIRPVAAAFLAVTLAILLEIGQAFLPDRYPSITDVFVEAIGGWIGAEVTTRAVALARGPGSSEGMWTR